ncbi:MAG: hypothetical protein JXX29_17100 [Deltaproteobacteria bacterium]|nr:hypothetical protein [Deltaproteobacteria bacterium]
MASTIIVTAGTEHLVTVALNGNTLYQTEVRVRSSQKLEIEVPETENPSDETTVEGPVAADDSPAETTEDHSAAPPLVSGKKNRLKPMGIAFTALGGALLIGGGITGIVAISKQKELDENCIDGVCYGGGTQEIEDSRNRLEVATDVLLGSGLAFAVTGVILLIAGKKKSERQTARIVPSVSMHGAGFMAEGRF